ncbi:uncharacterized protein LOC117590476 [Drosophila guanche]|uniref:Blast:Enkurin domain-containing protein 1 n=1 Tax=Drosophila guanche TaxID=7266 RepID=A0A3B0KU38_DROGU|nr:uncharacterized protein LOC117590476 [Drosophila guanche]SPP88811.1 blast:Enkurin domain-containing protein 1 [Drosophila guanche]
MSNPPVRRVTTLKGILSMPRVVRGRNFLKENKLSLRQLEKSTTEKLDAKKPVRPKWMPNMRREGSEMLDSKSDRPSPVSENKQNKTQDKTILARNRKSLRSYQQSGLAGSESDERFGGLEEPHTAFDDLSEKTEKDFVHSTDSEYCSSCGTQRSATSIGTQTEDIKDELYLTNALKKCSFDGGSTLSNQYNDNDEDEELLSPRKNMNDWNKMPMPDYDLNTEVASDEEAPLSARSRYTVATMASTATSTTSIGSKRREHKLGSRDQLRLPRYLEKMKRESAAALAKQLADTPDPDCPRGHSLLTEQERLGRLNSAQSRYDDLIREVNHMPFTSQSLWVRSRKDEINKELDLVDREIRLYSKPKVYIDSSKSYFK